MFRTFLSVWMLIWSGFAAAGAWGTGPFDNDDALDWVWELSESDDSSVIEATLDAAANSSGYLEAYTASVAIAAAEVVAASRGNPREVLPDEVIEWVRTHSVTADVNLLAIARKSIENAKNLEFSELAHLWMESDDLMDAWLKDLDDLLERLQ